MQRRFCWRHGWALWFANTTHAGRHDRDAQSITEIVVKRRANNDVGVGIDFLAYTACGLIDFVQRHIAAAGDRQQQSACPFQRHVVEKRIGDCFFGGKDRAAFAGCFTCSHHRRAHAAHDGFHICEIEIDKALF